MSNEQFANIAISDGIDAQMAQLSMEDIVLRHRREKKELQAKVQALKKSVSKNDKKKRKEVAEEVVRLEKELKERHISELNEVEERSELLHSRKNSVQSTTDSDASSFGLAQSNNGQQGQRQQQQQQQGQQRVSKAQRRREKKAREARDREREIQEELNSSGADKEPKTIELKEIKEKLAKLKLALYETTSDGNCLYNAVRHQLLELGMPAHTVNGLRMETAKYIRANKDSLICYMTNPETNELLNDIEFEEYCDAVRDTAAWGGQVELKALSTVLRVPIEVLQATGPPTIFGADEFSDPKLIITYHRHMYQMGEHYNSTIAKTKTTDDDDYNDDYQQLTNCT